MKLKLCWELPVDDVTGPQREVMCPWIIFVHLASCYYDKVFIKLGGAEGLKQPEEHIYMKKF